MSWERQSETRGQGANWATEHLGNLIHADGRPFDYQVLAQRVISGEICFVGVGGLPAIGKSSFLHALGDVLEEETHGKVAYSIISYSDDIQAIRKRVSRKDPSKSVTSNWTSKEWTAASLRCIERMWKAYQKGDRVLFEAIGMEILGMPKGSGVFDAFANRPDLAVYYHIPNPDLVFHAIEIRAHDTGTSAKPDAIKAHMASLYTQLLRDADILPPNQLGFLRRTGFPQVVERSLMLGENGFSRVVAAELLMQRIYQINPALGGVLHNLRTNAS